MSRVLRAVDRISDTVGNYASYFIALMALLMVIEVTARYLFNRPTSWIWPIDKQLMVLVFALAGCYAMRYHSHVRVDIIYIRLSEKKRAIINVASFILPLLFLCALFWVLIEVGWEAFLRGESDNDGFRPPVWHIKLIVIPIGVILMLMQTSAEFIRSLQTVLKRRQQ